MKDGQCKDRQQNEHDSGRKTDSAKIDSRMSRTLHERQTSSVNIQGLMSCDLDSHPVLYTCKIAALRWHNLVRKWNDLGSRPVSCVVQMCEYNHDCASEVNYRRQ